MRLAGAGLCLSLHAIGAAAHGSMQWPPIWMDDGGALPPAVWASVVVSGVAFAGVVACAVARVMGSRFRRIADPSALRGPDRFSASSSSDPSLWR